MEPLTNEVFDQGSTCAVTVGIILLLLIWRWYLLPYRSLLTCWAMKCFSSDYKRAKGIFDELVLLEKEYQSKRRSLTEGYIDLLLYIKKQEGLFRSLDEVEKRLQRKKDTLSVDDFLEGKEISSTGHEFFIAFFGKGKNLHKVSIFFSLEETVHLQHIDLFYHEEKKRNSFMYEIKKKEFPPDEGGARGRHLPEPGPTILAVV